MKLKTFKDDKQGLKTSNVNLLSNEYDKSYKGIKKASN